MNRQSRYKLFFSVLMATVVVGFQNCSQMVSQTGPTSNDQKGQGVSGGTTTDNPMTSSLKVSFAKFTSDVQTSLCVGGSQFSSAKSTGLTQQIQATTSLRVAAATTAEKFDDDRTADGGASHHHRRHPAGIAPIIFAAPNAEASIAATSDTSGSQDMAMLAQSMNNPLQLAPLSPEGTPLGQQQIREGTYNQLVLHLNGGCAAGASVTVTNEKGTFSAVEPIDLVFAGELTAEAGVHEISLDVSRHLHLLERVESSDQIKRVLESVTGSIR